MNYRLFVPDEQPKGAPLFVAVHGCLQGAGDFAHGTRFDLLGERHGAMVLYPEQDERANGQRCWNWFLPENQHRDGPEPAAVLELVERVSREHDIDRSRVYLAGLSAGACLAAILAEQAPDVFAGVAAMAGVALHAARDVESAYAAMRGELVPEDLAGGLGTVAYRRSRAIIWAGARDVRVAPVNAWLLGRQFAHLYGLDEVPDREEIFGGGKRSIWHDRTGKARLEVRELDAIGHAWSGGSLRGSYTAPVGPNFSEALFRFFLEGEAETEQAMQQCG
ncbi:MAG: extracellular catalytic domain type 1 short-chain-length polyhydroxyalkanoate depolymerase [Vulcanimicrobiaceae bacterium]